MDTLFNQGFIGASLPIPNWFTPEQRVIDMRLISPRECEWFKSIQNKKEILDTVSSLFSQVAEGMDVSAIIPPGTFLKEHGKIDFLMNRELSGITEKIDAWWLELVKKQAKIILELKENDMERFLLWKIYNGILACTALGKKADIPYAFKSYEKMMAPFLYNTK